MPRLGQTRRVGNPNSKWSNVGGTPLTNESTYLQTTRAQLVKETMKSHVHVAISGNHHHHQFICPIIQQNAHLHRYNFRRAGQQGPTRTLTAALRRVIKQLLGTYSITQVKYYKPEKLKKSIFSTLFLKTTAWMCQLESNIGWLLLHHSVNKCREVISICGYWHNIIFCFCTGYIWHTKW